MTYCERFILRQSRLHSGLAQVFLVLFALLVILAPTFDATLSGNEVEEYVSASADPSSDAAIAVSASLGVAEELEEEADQEEATFLALAPLHCTWNGDSQATDAWHFSFPHLSVHSCTGPPTL